MARPSAPPSRCTSTSTVGLPRESRTSRPIISAMLVCISRGYDARSAGPVHQMLRKRFGQSLGADEEAPSNSFESILGGTHFVVSHFRRRAVRSSKGPTYAKLRLSSLLAPSKNIHAGKLDPD